MCSILKICVDTPRKYWCVSCGYRAHMPFWGAILVLVGVLLMGIFPETITGIVFFTTGLLIVFMGVLGRRVGPHKECRLMLIERYDDDPNAQINFVNEEFDLEV